ncbi:MAG: VTT domain-containing protein [Candidatus Velthaea sp.]
MTASPNMHLRRLEAVAIFLASFALAAFVVAKRSAVEQFLGTLGPFAMPLAAVILAIVASAPFSITDALAIMNGVLFGPLWGSVVNAAGIVLAAIIGYYVALRTSRLLDIEAQVQRLPRWARHFKIGSPMFLIAVRIIPGFGGTIATQTAAALRVPLFRQIYTMSAIAIPICTLLAVGGDFLSNYIEAHVMAPAQAYADKHHLHVRIPRHGGTRETPSPSPADAGP